MLPMRHVHISLLIVLRMRKNKKKTYFWSLWKKKSGIPIAQESTVNIKNILF